MSTGIDSSFLRRVAPMAFANCDQWASSEAVPQSACDQFRLPDGKTSLWDEDIRGTHRDTIMLAIALQRRSLRSVCVGSLYSLSLSRQLAARFRQTVGDTPLVRARNLHYEIIPPKEEDYRELAFAVASRNDIFSLETRAVADHIEDAFECGDFKMDELEESLRVEVAKMFKKRRIMAADLNVCDVHTIVDVRRLGHSGKIPRARWADPDKVREKCELFHGVRKKDVITLYCEDGCESRDIARHLRASGYDFVRVLIGGFAAWTAAGLPVDS